MDTYGQIVARSQNHFLKIIFAFVLVLPLDLQAKAKLAPSPTFAPTPTAQPKLQATSYWIGHHAVFGTRHLPLLGELDHRTDSYVLAAMQLTDQGRWIEEWACDVRMQPVLGIKTYLNPAAFTYLPATTSFLQRITEPLNEPIDGPWQGIWQVDWQQMEDVDQDGLPGLTVHVDAPLCGGQLYMANASSSTGTLRRFGQLLLGELRVEIRQHRLGASNGCLRLGNPNHKEVLHGISAYMPTDVQTTCASLRHRPWPIDATKPQHDIGQIQLLAEKMVPSHPDHSHL